MALNYSHCPIFPACLPEDNLVNPMRIVNGYVVEGMPERGEGGFVRPHHVNREGRDRVDRSGSPESVSRDIIDLLPSDPFGMDIDISTTFTAITGWLEDMEVDYGGYGRNNIGSSREDYGLFAGLNLIWNSALRFQSFPSNVMFDHISYTPCLVDRCTEGRELWDVFGQGTSGSAHNADDMVCCNSGSTSALATKSEESRDVFGCFPNGVDGAPHEAFVLALSYLGLRDLLSVEQVCRSLCSTVRNDSLLWRSIHIDQPLNERITDDVLVQITNRAEGNLCSLSLVGCQWITDLGLKRVLETNPKLTKLYVPGCTKINIERFMDYLKAFNSGKGTAGVKHLRIGGVSGLHGVTHEQFEELKYLLGADSHMQRSDYKPHYFRRGMYLLCDDDLAIDIEICPRCQNVRLVYDCPAEGCQAKGHAADVCRACSICIPRCVQCGRCLNNSEYEETFCLELLCSHCSMPLPRCQEEQDIQVGFTQNDVLHKPMDGFCLHG